MSFDSRAIANRILEIASSKDIKLTMMQLLKLVYFSHGWWLTFSDGEPLTADSPEAWRYGPVYPAVYHAFRRFGSGKITELSIDPISGFEFTAEISDEIDSVIEQVVTSYGNIHAYKLSDMTHQPGTPWDMANKQSGNYASISNISIKEHFDELRQPQT